MARRKDRGLLVELMDAPWWLGAAITVVVYAACINATRIVTFDSPLMASFNNLLGLLESWALYVSLPFAMASIIAVFKGWRRRQLLERQTDIDSIRNLSWQDFEILVGEAFRRQGYAVEENGGGGADGGVDLRLRKNGKVTIVQCKRWKTQKVGVSPIRELFGLMTAEAANGSIFVCSGSYTKDATQFADQNGLLLIDGDALYELVNDVQEPVAPNVEAPDKQESVSPSCPSCGGEMVLRVAKRGTNSGQEFWGCQKIPVCRSIVKI